MSSVPIKVTRDLFPQNGPYTAETVIAAAAVIADLWHYLDRAFEHRAAAIEPLENLTDAHAFAIELARADHRAADVLKRLTYWANYISSRSLDTDTYGIIGDDGSPDQVASLMNGVSKRLDAAATAHSTVAESLDRVHSQLSYVYNNDKHISI